MTLFSMLLLLVLFSSPLFAQSDIVGFWKSINEKTKLPESLIAIYEYQGKYYGRIVSTFNSDGKVQELQDSIKSLAPGVKGNPSYIGMDILWDLTKQDNKYVNGKILDPEKGKVYDAEAWRDRENLIVRGEILVFGRNQTWVPAIDVDFPKGFQKPDLTHLTPAIPEVNP
jgi:uncharacterized protein (DUF2147 family)